MSVSEYSEHNIFKYEGTFFFSPRINLINPVVHIILPGPGLPLAYITRERGVEKFNFIFEAETPNIEQEHCSLNTFSLSGGDNFRVSARGFYRLLCFPSVSNKLNRAQTH